MDKSQLLLALGGRPRTIAEEPEGIPVVEPVEEVARPKPAWEVREGDCIAVMQTMEADSVDAIVTDPPYGLEFMGKEWDKLGGDAGTSKPGIGDRKTEWPTFGGQEFGGTNPSCAVCGGRLRGKKKCNCETPDWRVKGEKCEGGGRADAARMMQDWHYAWSVEALRVLKPGGYILAFGGTRTFHRLACAIEDAGFEIRDCVMWVYGCLSEDTEVLTRDGWERYHTAKTKEILAYDVQGDIYKWERPSRWSEYRVESDTAFRIVSDSTDQLVSRSHRCLVDRGGNLVFVAAESLAGVERVPVLSDDLLGIPEGHGAVLQPGVQRVGAGGGVESTRAQGACGVVAGSGGVVPRQDDGGAQPGMERWADILQAQGEVRGPVDSVRPLSSGVRVDGTQRRVRDGASASCGAGDRASVDASGVCASHQPRCGGQPDRELGAVSVERGPQEARTRTSYRASLATITPVEYTGLIFCPTVSTGAFVARRSGKVFITGNSGFPKSLDVSKAIDKAAGAERGVVGYDASRARPNRLYEGGAIGNIGGTGKVSDRTDNGATITAPATEDAKKWNGWGTALKPAYEPIIVARKPLIGTVAANILKHGTGALNIDACRVDAGSEVVEDDGRRVETSCHDGYKRPGASMFNTGKPVMRQGPSNSQGRWPANVIHDGSEEVVGLFPSSSGKGGDSSGGTALGQGSGWNAHNNRTTPIERRNDEGSAARFFYCAKASRRDRNDGCEELEEREGGTMSGGDVVSDGRTAQKTGRVMRTNHHPTVKPTSLMRYLCRLVTSPDGLVLDPFAGSGSTGKACMLERFRFVGIEQDADYAAIARARIGAVP